MHHSPGPLLAVRDCVRVFFSFFTSLPRSRPTPLKFLLASFTGPLDPSACQMACRRFLLNFSTSIPPYFTQQLIALLSLLSHPSLRKFLQPCLKNFTSWRRTILRFHQEKGLHPVLGSVPIANLPVLGPVPIPSVPSQFDMEAHLIRTSKRRKACGSTYSVLIVCLESVVEPLNDRLLLLLGGGLFYY